MSMAVAVVQFDHGSPIRWPSPNFQSRPTHIDPENQEERFQATFGWVYITGWWFQLLWFQTTNQISRRDDHECMGDTKNVVQKIIFSSQQVP